MSCLIHTYTTMNCSNSAIKTDDEPPNPAPKQAGIASIDKIAKISGLSHEELKAVFNKRGQS